MANTLWIARDKNGDLSLYDKKPIKQRFYWTVNVDDCDGNYLGNIDDSLLPDGSNPQWEDEEPIKVKLIKAE